MSLIRYFSIFLVIKLATESQVSAFALRPNQSADVEENGKIQEKSGPDNDKGIDIETIALPQGIVPIGTKAKTETLQNNLDNSKSSVGVSPTSQEQKFTEDSRPLTRPEESIQNSANQTKSTNTKKYNSFQRVSNLPDNESTTETKKLNDSVSTTPLNVISITTTESSTSSKLSTTISEGNDKILVPMLKETSPQARETARVKEDTTSVRNDVSSSESVTTTTSLPKFTITSTENIGDINKSELEKSTDSPHEFTVKGAAPHGKIYTTIERKRLPMVSESESNSTDTDLDRAQSAQSEISLKQVLGNAEIPSLEKLKDEFLTSALSSLTTDTSPVTLPINEPADIFTTDKTTAITIRMLKPENILTAQMAGFINYSKPITSSETTIITDKDPTKTQSSAMTESTRVVQQTSDGINGAMASQSLLAEDAMNEELMKEEILNNNIVTTKRNTEEYNVTSPSQTQSELDTTTQDTTTSTSDDKLSVKPITKMYPLNKNYKPLKKIEVQPSKPFLRNPDDNSWRNESLSSQGIVFKANNSSKTFTQGLKNKTETELNAISDKENKESAQELLGERLKKITEIRKTKNNKFGISMSSDYLESGETTTKAVTSDTVITSTSLLSVKPNPASRTTANGGIQTIKLTEIEDSTTQMPRKDYAANENFEDEDDDSDFITFPDIDIKKYITSLKTSKYPFPSTKTTPLPSQLSQFPERKPTIQYFPPRQSQKVNINDYDDGFKIKINAFMEPKIQTTPASQTEILKNDQVKNKSFLGVSQTDNKLKKSRYNIQNEPNTGFGNASPDGGYIINHWRDFINQASKGNDDRDAPYFMTDIPVRGITVHSDLTKNKKQSEYDDYGNEFRKDVLVKFVENFNLNSDRFKVDFPILYNTSIIHNKENAALKSYLRRGYEDTNKIKSGVKYDPNCDRTVELSPEYELHYFVPEQEEREVVEPKTLPPPYKHYRIQE